MKYRSEIDGLRAVAVAPVVMFHAGIAGFGGGFVGVDVFFVISGYLITSLILQESAIGSFSLRAFYERRARRILPALLLVILACLPFAYLWMMPEAVTAFSTSAVYVVLSLSNFFFYMRSGYFDQAAELKPLLHTWSLGVEEQFYILFPLLLVFLLRFGRRVVFLSLLFLFAASLLIAQTGGNFEPHHSLHQASWSWNNYPSWGFYMLPSRAFELLLGSMIAVSGIQAGEGPVPFTGLLREACSLAGLLMIASAILLFDRTTPFPSLYTLMPTIGAGLVIVFANEGTIAHRLLTIRAVVGLGLISYSVYLWHHALFAFARIYSLNRPGPLVFLGLAAVSVGLAYLSWRFVELPFRNRTRVRAGTAIKSLAFSALLLVIFIVADSATKGFQYRFPKDEFIVADLAESQNKCKKDDSEDPSKACLYGRGEPTVAIVGDSHAKSLVGALGRELGGRGTAVAALHVPGCVPVRNYLRLYTWDRCRRQDAVLDYLKRTDTIKHVVFAVRWATKFEVSRFDNQEGGVEFGDPTILYPDQERTKPGATLADAIAESVHELLDGGKTVVLTYPIPEVGWDVPNYMAKLKMRGRLDDDISTSYAVFKDRTRQATAALDAVGEHANLHRVFPEKLFCNSYREGRCMASLNLKSFYKDDNHLGPLGAQMVVEQIVAKLDLPDPRVKVSSEVSGRASQANADK